MNYEVSLLDWGLESLKENVYIKARIGWKGLKKSEFRPVGDFYIVNGPDLQNDKVIWTQCQFISKERYDESEEIQLKVNDILLTKDGTVGKMAFIDSLPKPATLASGIFVIRNKSNVFDPKFIYYFLKSPNFRRLVDSRIEGSVIPHLYQRDLVELGIPVPSLTEQKLIGEIFSHIDDKIELNNKINKTLEEMARTIFKSWFVDFESFPNGEFVESEIGLVPKGWRVQRLADFFPVKTGKKDANVSGKSGKYPFFSCSKEISWTDEYSFEGKAILVAGNGDFNVKYYDGKFEAYQRTYVLVPKNENLSGLLYFCIVHNLDQITKGHRGSVIKFITKGNIEDFKIAMPPNLDNYSSVFQKIVNTCQDLTKEVEKLSVIRDSLLPKLMSGEVRVPIKEET